MHGRGTTHEGTNVEERPLLMEYADFADYWEPILRGEGPMESYVAGLGEAERARLAIAQRWIHGIEDRMGRC